MHNHLHYKQVKLKELGSWIYNHVYKTVENQNQECIPVRWVCSVKPKARLIACSFDDSLCTFDKESPAVSKDTLRALLSTIITDNLNLKSIVIKTAFLQGEFLRRDVYFEPPSEAHCDNYHIWKLNKCVYGLTDASLMWFKGKNVCR